MFIAADDNFFDSSTWAVTRNLSLFLVVVFWLATAYWVYKDARRRIDDPWLVAMAALLGLVPPFLGPIIYLFFRPPESLAERRERELEIRAIEERLAERRSALPCLPWPGRLLVPRLSRLHDAAEAGVRRLRRPARADLAGMPVLRHSGAAGCRQRRGDPAAAAHAPQVGPGLPGPFARRSGRPGGWRRSAPGAATTLPAPWLPKPHSSSSSRTASPAGSAARSSPASSVAATSCAAPGC